MSQGVEFNRLMLDMRAMQADAMSLPKVAAAPELAPGQSTFADMLGQAIGKVHETQQASTQLANAFEIGKSGVDLTDVMIASQKASVSMQALTCVRNKLVQYQTSCRCRFEDGCKPWLKQSSTTPPPKAARQRPNHRCSAWRFWKTSRRCPCCVRSASWSAWPPAWRSALPWCCGRNNPITARCTAAWRVWTPSRSWTPAAADIPYNVEPNSGALLVKADDLSRARLKLAAAGVAPSDGNVGFELLDKEQGTGTSQFMEATRYRRSLEGELARTVSSLNNVKGARVHWLSRKVRCSCVTNASPVPRYWSSCTRAVPRKPGR